MLGLALDRVTASLVNNHPLVTLVHAQLDQDHAADNNNDDTDDDQDDDNEVVAFIIANSALLLCDLLDLGDDLDLLRLNDHVHSLLVAIATC